MSLFNNCETCEYLNKKTVLYGSDRKEYHFYCKHSDAQSGLPFPDHINGELIGNSDRIPEWCPLKK